MDVDVGTVIAGKYELVRLLGKGAMGEVWAATHNSLGGEFAVKLVEPTDDIEAETAAGRFQLEAQIAAKLSRKTRHIVSVSDHGEENGLAYLVMELLDGESLEARLKRTGPLEPPEVAAILMQVCRALGLAHDEGIFHRDMKPANIFLSKDEDGRMLVKILDFGIARATKVFKTRSPFATSKDMVLGTPSYMSPEQARGLDSLDHRCDLWALCTCAYEALAKRIPFEGETVEDLFLSICTFRVIPIQTLRADLGDAVEAFFKKAFAPKLDDRFANAQQLADAFAALVDPAAIEPFLGIGPGSVRRLQAASSPSHPDLTPAVAAVAAPAPRVSAPSLDAPPPGTLESHAAGVPRRKGKGAFIAAGAGAVAIALLGMFALRATHTKDANAASSAPASETSAEPNARNEVPPPSDSSITVETASAPATPSTAPTTANLASTPPKKDSSKKDSRKGGRAVSGHGSPATTHAATAAATAATTTAAPAPAPQPGQRTHDKDEVF